MPVCKVDDFKNKKAEGLAVTQEECEELRQLIGKCINMEDAESTTMVNKFENYINLIEDSNKDISDENLEEILEGLKEFEYYFREKTSDNNNYGYRIIFDLDEKDGKRFIELVSKVDSVYETDVDIKDLEDSYETKLEEKKQKKNSEAEKKLGEDLNDIHLNDSIVDDKAHGMNEADNDKMIGEDIQDEEEVPSLDEYLELKEEGKGLDDDRASDIGMFFRNDIEDIFYKKNLYAQFPGGLKEFGRIILNNGMLKSTNPDEIKKLIRIQKANRLEDDQIGDDSIEKSIEREIYNRNEENKTIKEDFEKLKGFKAFLEEKDESQKSNFNKIYEVLSDAERRKLMRYLEQLDSVFHMGLKPIIKSVNPDAEIEDYVLSGMPKNVEQTGFDVTMELKILSITGLGNYVKDQIKPNLNDADNMLYKAWDFYGRKIGNTDDVRKDYDNSLKYAKSLYYFLNRKEEGYDKTNFQRTIEVIEENKRNEFISHLRNLNMFSITDFDIDQLNKIVENSNDSKEKHSENKQDIDNKPEIESNDKKNDDGYRIDYNQQENDQIENDQIDNNLINNQEDNNSIIDNENNINRINQTGKEKTNPSVPVSAARYIEDIKASLADRMEADGLLQEKIMKILAARNIADSVRHKRGRLDSTMVTEEQINAKVHELNQNATIRQFVDHITQHENRREAINAIDVRGRGHCGKLDDMLKDYALNADAAGLDNSEIMTRYMPSAKERIEALQDKLKDRNRPIEDKRKIVIEIMKIRNISRAVRKDKSSLEKPVPVTDPSLSSFIGPIYNNIGTDNLEKVITEDVIRAATSGHGGDMLDMIRENVKSNDIKNVQINKLAFGNTIETRMDKLKDRAYRLQTLIQEQIKVNGDTVDLIRKSKNVIAEYLLLDGQTRGKGEINADAAKLKKDVPWDKVSTMKRKGPDNEKQFRNTFKGYTDDDFANALLNMSQNSSSAFVNSLSEKQRQLTEARNQAKRTKNKSSKADKTKPVNDKTNKVKPIATNKK